MRSASFGRCVVVSTTICALILLSVIITTVPLSAHGVSRHHESHCKPPYTKLYIYTYPVQTECVLLKHTGNVSALNRSNTEYNAGVVAGQKASQGISFTGWKCPVSHTKSFCAGWNQTACSSEGCGGDYTCANPNQPKGAKACRPCL